MKPPFIPPKPIGRPDKVNLWQHIQLFRRDIFSSQPQRLYRAWMAEFKMPFFRSYFANDPNLVNLVLKERPEDFPKSNIVSRALASLLGTGVFVSNGELWKFQRRIIDPAFEGGRLRDVFPSMLEAANAAVDRLKPRANGADIEIEEQTSQLAADVIFRTLFSIPITDDVAKVTFDSFRDYQRTQPLMNLASLLKLPALIPSVQRRSTKRASAKIREQLRKLTDDRATEITHGTAPDDLATKIMTMADPETGRKFTAEEMVDQVAIFFLAGHETSASALAWALFLLAVDQETQQRVAQEVAALNGEITFANLSKLGLTRDVFRETLRLYPPVPMMVRETTRPETFRNRKIKIGSQIVLSPWHIQRHERLWDRPDEFDPDRWKTEETRKCARDAYMPFSAGRRVCTGAGFAMVEGVLLLAVLIQAFKFEPIENKMPQPVTHLTVRGKDGIWLRLTPR